MCWLRLASIFEEVGWRKWFTLENHIQKFTNCCTNKNEKVLVVGDNIRTDIKGANNMKFDSLFITDGIHRNEFLNLTFEKYDRVLENYGVKTNFFQKKLTW